MGGCLSHSALFKDFTHVLFNEKLVYGNVSGLGWNLLVLFDEYFFMFVNGGGAYPI